MLSITGLVFIFISAWAEFKSNYVLTAARFDVKKEQQSNDVREESLLDP